MFLGKEYEGKLMAISCFRQGLQAGCGMTPGLSVREFYLREAEEEKGTQKESGDRTHNFQNR